LADPIGDRRRGIAQCVGADAFALVPALDGVECCEGVLVLAKVVFPEALGLNGVSTPG
jgi:hypothetical protein